MRTVKINLDQEVGEYYVAGSFLVGEPAREHLRPTIEEEELQAWAQDSDGEFEIELATIPDELRKKIHDMVKGWADERNEWSHDVDYCDRGEDE